MAGNAVIGALRVVLGLDSAQFEDGLKKSRGKLNDFGKTAGVAFAAATAAAGAAAIALGYAVKRSIDAADSMSKAAQKVGTTTEALSRLKHAADLSGIGFESLQTSMTRLNVGMVEVAAGAGGKAKTAFDALGISVTKADGTMRSNLDVLGELADRFARMEDGSMKSALAVSIFGRSGAELIPLLNAGSSGLADMAAEADRLGLTLSTRAGKAAEAFNDNLSRAQMALQGVVNRIMEAVIPALAELTNTFADPQFQQAVADFANVAVRFFNAIISGAANAANNVRILKDMFSDLGNTSSQGLEERLRQIGLRKVELDNLMRESESRLKRGDTGMFGMNEGALRGQIASAGEQIAALIEEERKILALLDQRDADASGGGATTDTTPSLLPPVSPAALASFDEAKAALEAMRAEGEAIKGALMNPFEAMEAGIARLSELLKAGAIDMATFQETSNRMRLGTASEVLGMVGDISGAFATLFKDNKAFAIANAVINTAEGVTKALAQGGAWGIPAAAAIAASGAAQVASILSAQPGSASVSAVGVDGAAAAASMGQQRAVNVTLVGNGFSGGQVSGLLRDIAEGLNTNADGARDFIFAVNQQGAR